MIMVLCQTQSGYDIYAIIGVKSNKIQIKSLFCVFVTPFLYRNLVCNIPLLKNQPKKKKKQNQHSNCILHLICMCSNTPTLNRMEMEMEKKIMSPGVYYKFHHIVLAYTDGSFTSLRSHSLIAVKYCCHFSLD